MGDTQANQRKKTRGEDYIAQGSILAVAVVITKIIGVVYRIPLTNILGDEGNGFYGYAYQVYAIALMLSSLSLPTAVSKLVSVRMAVGQRRNAFRVFLCSLIFAVSVGIIISLAIFLGAGAISEHMMKAPFSVYALKVLSPGLLIVAVMAVLRGYFQDWERWFRQRYRRLSNRSSMQLSVLSEQASFSEWEVVRERRREKSC